MFGTKLHKAKHVRNIPTLNVHTNFLQNNNDHDMNDYEFLKD